MKLSIHLGKDWSMQVYFRDNDQTDYPSDDLTLRRGFVSIDHPIPQKNIHSFSLYLKMALCPSE